MNAEFLVGNNSFFTKVHISAVLDNWLTRRSTDMFQVILVTYW